MAFWVSPAREARHRLQSRRHAISVIAELILEVLLQVFFGMAPERPIWLRRLVQALWLLLGLLVLVAAGFGLVYLVQAL